MRRMKTIEHKDELFKQNIVAPAYYQQTMIWEQEGPGFLFCNEYHGPVSLENVNALVWTVEPDFLS